MVDLGQMSGSAMAVAIGLLFAGIGGYLYMDQQAAIENSERIEATVVNSHVQVDEGTGTEADSYYPVVEYEYTYDGQTYTSDNVFPGVGSSSTSLSRAREIVDDYQQGDQVTAYVNPDDPQEAYLIEETDSLFHFAFIGAGGLAVLLGIGGIVRGIFS